MSEKLKFYGHIKSPTCRAVQALLAIGKVPHEKVIVNFYEGQTKKKEYLARFPFGHIPAITLGDLSLGESCAIMAFLCDKYPDHVPESYYPKDVFKRAKVNQILSWYQAQFRPAISSIVFLKIYGVMVNKQTLTAEKLKNAEKSIEVQLKLFDSLLGSRKTPFIAGEQVTIADLLLYFELSNVMLYKKEWSQYKNMDAWFKKMYGIPELKQITHAWFPTIKQTVDLLDSIQPIQPKL